jgi:transposase
MKSIVEKMRFLDKFVNSLDLLACGFHFPKDDQMGRGRPAYHPGTLLKLYIYGYIHGIRSGRKLEKEGKVNLEVIWLLQKLTPDFKTICDFRRKNKDAFRKVAAQFTELCRRKDLFGGELVAIDGTKIKAVNSPSNSWTGKKIEGQLSRVEKSIDEYMKALELSDEVPAENDDGRRKVLAEKLARSQARKRKLEEMRREMRESGHTQISLTDPDCRSMSKNGQTTVGYNIQAAVDSKNRMIAATMTTNSINDMGLLAPVAGKAKEQLGGTGADVVADKGYYRGEDLKKCEEMDMTPNVAELKNSPSERVGLFGRNDFRHDPEKDIYICPAGRELLPQSGERSGDRKTQSYRNVAACRDCLLKKRCTSSEYRSVNHSEYEEYYARCRERIIRNPEKLKKRGSIVEHVFGILKQRILIGGFLVKGIQMVAAEMELAHLAYNMKRAFSIGSFSKWMESIAKNKPRQAKSSSKPQNFLDALMKNILNIITWQDLYKNGNFCF